MDDFKTVEEKSIEWKVAPRYIQLLCRQGKIQGAIKRAGVWFIPNVTANPVKRNKLNGKSLRFRGTKGKIFEKAVELFAQKSYEFTTVKDIADAVGIKPSAMYNHFKSKQEILDSVYDFYCCYFSIDRPILEDLDPVLKRGSLLDIINFTTYEFHDDYRLLMINVTKIMFNRKFIDERARKIVETTTIKEGIEFVEAVFNKAVEVGRIAPINTHDMAVFCNSVRIFLFYNLVLNPANNKKWLAAEQNLFKHAAKLLTDLTLSIDSSQSD